MNLSFQQEQTVTVAMAVLRIQLTHDDEVEMRSNCAWLHHSKPSPKCQCCKRRKHQAGQMYPSSFSSEHPTILDNNKHEILYKPKDAIIWKDTSSDVWRCSGWKTTFIDHTNKSISIEDRLKALSTNRSPKIRLFAEKQLSRGVWLTFDDVPIRHEATSDTFGSDSRRLDGSVAGSTTKKKLKSDTGIKTTGSLSFLPSPRPPLDEYAPVKLESRTSLFSSGDLASSFEYQARYEKAVRDYKNQKRREDQRPDAKIHAFVDILRDAFAVEYLTRIEKERFKDLLIETDKDIFKALLNGAPLTEAQRAHLKRRRKMAGANQRHLCPDGTCPNDRCAKGGNVHRDLTHYINGLPEAEATEIFRTGGWYAFYKTGNAFRLTALVATDEESAQDAYDNLYEKTRREAVRKIKKYDRPDVSARIDKAFDDGFFTYWPPEPDYIPLGSSTVLLNSEMA